MIWSAGLKNQTGEGKLEGPRLAAVRRTAPFCERRLNVLLFFQYSRFDQDAPDLFPHMFRLKRAVLVACPGGGAGANASKHIVTYQALQVATIGIL